MEVYAQERTLVMDNFRLTEGYGFKSFSKLKTNTDKGHHAQFKLLTERVRDGGGALIPFEEIYNTTIATFAALESLTEHRWVDL